MSIYINATGNISPQKTADNSRFLEEPLSYEGLQLRSIDPGYKEFIPADMIRRMGRIIKMGVAASKICLKEAGYAPCRMRSLRGQAWAASRIPRNSSRP